MRDKMRYFLGASGQVYPGSDFRDGEPAEGTGPYAEVRVVPLDAIVLDGPLPKVTRHDDGRYAVAGDPGRYYLSADDTPASLRESARPQAARLLALANYLEQHPVVDEEQVKAVTDALYAATSDPDDINVPDVARRLVERGVRVGGESDV